VKHFALQESGLKLERRAHPHAPYDVLGRRAAVLGREDGTFEMWAYPLKTLSDFRLTFQVPGERGPEEIPAAQIVTTITVRPEATILTFTHAAFTVREIIFVPLDQPAAIVLLEVDSAVPLRVIGSFERQLKLMWPAETSQSQMQFDKVTSTFLITDREKKFAGLIGTPGAQDVTLTDQGKSKNALARFTIDTTPFVQNNEFVPILIVGAPEGGGEAARKLYSELLNSIERTYNETATYYQRFLQRTLQIVTPDAQLNQAFEWAKVRIDKGYVTNPFLGSGLVAGFRTSSDTKPPERPGFAWFFGRDALWTTLALNSYGDFEHARGALQLLKKHQRADGKIMHELSQAASFVNWAATPYYYASADSTPLYIIAIEDYYQASGDLKFVQEMWESVRKAYEFSVSTDRDGNGLIENTNVGHGWVEGGRLLPAHEEIYLQGLWIEACHALARLAEAMNNGPLAAACRQRAQQVVAAAERIFWKEQQGIYAFARRQNDTTVDEITVMPAVPLWWGLLNEERSARMLEHIASSAITTDWGARILSNQSDLYDPLSYHYGSVWPLFTGWASMACYRYHRPLAGYELLMANAWLTFDEVLGAHTELLSGDRYRSFGFSSFDQIWSSAMVITPLVRGLLGLEWDAPHRRLTLAPQLPADWERVEIRNLHVGETTLDFIINRRREMMALDVTRRGGEGPVELKFLPTFPLDAKVTSVKINGQPISFEMIRGREDQACRLIISFTASLHTEIVYTPGTQLIVPLVPAQLGDQTRRLKIIRTNTTNNAFTIEAEGLSGTTYQVRLSTPRSIRQVTGAEIISREGSQYRLALTFPKSEPPRYLRQRVSVEFTPPARVNK
jgi:glycogen debranching enzyme